MTLLRIVLLTLERKSRVIVMNVLNVVTFVAVVKISIAISNPFTENRGVTIAFAKRSILRKTRSRFSYRQRAAMSSVRITLVRRFDRSVSAFKLIFLF